MRRWIVAIVFEMFPIAVAAILLYRWLRRRKERR